LHLQLHGQSVAAVQPTLWFQQQHIGLYSGVSAESVHFAAPTMADAPAGVTLEQAHAAVTRQGDAVRSLKAAVKEGNAQKVVLVCSTSMTIVIVQLKPCMFSHLLGACT
jgi:hypothetical protein